jgi:hypothetical protein
MMYAPLTGTTFTNSPVVMRVTMPAPPNCVGVHSPAVPSVTA